MLNPRLLVPGAVIAVDTYRGEKEGYVGRVVEVRDTHEQPVTKRTHKGNVVTRSRFLFTLEDDSGAFRSYYHAFVEGKILGTDVSCKGKRPMGSL